MKLTLINIELRLGRQALLFSTKKMKRVATLTRYDAHCCRVGTAIKHPVPDLVKPAVICNF